ncbi:Calcium/calmodulin-dependent protein kinase type I, partial [Conglomerata obtusa]
QYAWIVMEKLDIDITFEYVKRNKKIITTIIKDISAALKYLHDQKIAHLDVKLENIMGKRVENEVVYKLIDFGYSRIIDNGLVRFKDMSLGTFPYKPPEIVFHNIHSTKADIWALGASVYFLLLNKFICFEKDAFNMQKYVTFLNQNVLLFNENTDNELMNFVISCMINDYRHRPSINEIIIDIT